MTYIAHGTDPNEIGHGVNIDLNDTPGSTGGKFIGFGEDGTSANANRAHWFLSQNIDHVYQEVHREIAVPKGYDRTSPGGGESTFQFPSGEEIWVGDTTYPGSAGSSDLEGMHMLFDVLDSNYNELTDGADNEIRVKLVRESTNTTDMYKGGNPFTDSFQDQPIIHFIAVDPATGATVTDPYTIPAATNYKVQCGVKSTIAELPADALVRYKVQGATEVEAGMFLQDGTRPMTGNLDLDGNNLINTDVVSNVTGEPLDITSDDDLLFKDQYLSAGLALSESGQTALYQPVDALVHPSLVGAVNSGVEAQEFMQGDRSMDRTGSFTTGAAPAMTHPAITVSLGGQILHFASDTVTASGSGDGQYYLYVTAAGVLSFGKFANWAAVIAASAGAIPIWTGELTGSETSWDGPIDLRWAGTAGKHNAIYVGTGVGADFTSLNDVSDFLAVTAYDSEDANVNYEIIVVGEATVSSTVTVPHGWTIRGLSRRGYHAAVPSVINTSATGYLVTSHVLNLGVNCTVKDVTINWGNDTDQNSDYAGIWVKGGCSVENVTFTTTTNVFGLNVKILDTIATGPIISNCSFSEFSIAGISAVGEGRVHVENSIFETPAAATYSIVFSPSGATGDARGPSHTIRGCYFNGGGTTANIVVGGPNVLIDSCQANLVDSTSPFIKIEAFASQNAAGVTVRNCLAEDGYTFVQTEDINDSAVKLMVVIESCTLTGFANRVFNIDCTAVAVDSSVSITGCVIAGHIAGYVGYFKAVSTHFVQNRVIDSAGTGFYVYSTTANFEGNYVRTWGSGVGITFATGGKGSVYNNTIYYNGSTDDTIGLLAVYNSLGVNIDSNYFLGDNDDGAIAIKLQGPGNRVVNNRFKSWSQYFIHIDSSNDNAGNQWIANNLFDSGCGKLVTEGGLEDVAASAIYISGANDAKNLVITGNIFDGHLGSSIRCKDGNSDGTAVSNNIFEWVHGRHLLAGPDLTKYAVIALEAGGGWTISNNMFRHCGHATALTPGSATELRMSAIYLNNTKRVIISNNHFVDSVANGSDVTNLTESWADIRLNSTGDVVCTGDIFYQDLSYSVPKSLFSQINRDYGTSTLIITGCSFTITGTASPYTTAYVYSVYCDGTAVTIASGCYTFGDFTCGVANNDLLWSVGGGYGNVMGNYFDGAHPVSIYLTGGFVMGNVHANLTGATAWTLGEEPTGTIATYNKEYTGDPT